MAGTAGGYNIDNYLIPIDSTLRLYNVAGSNMNVLGVSPDAIGKIEVDGVTLTTNAQGAMTINLANPNTWTAAQTFPVATFSNLLSNANTWTALQTFGNDISFGGATLNVASLATGQYIYYNGTNWVNTNVVDGTTLINSSGTLSINLANPNTWTATQTFNASINPNISQSTLSGTTAGSVVYSMPFQGSSYKKFIAYANGYENDTTTTQSITFPVAFSTVADITFNNTGLTVGNNLTSLTISAPDSTNTYTGMIIVEGF